MSDSTQTVIEGQVEYHLLAGSPPITLYNFVHLIDKLPETKKNDYLNRFMDRLFAPCPRATFCASTSYESPQALPESPVSTSAAQKTRGKRQHADMSTSAATTTATGTMGRSCTQDWQDQAHEEGGTTSCNTTADGVHCTSKLLPLLTSIQTGCRNGCPEANVALLPPNSLPSGVVSSQTNVFASDSGCQLTTKSVIAISTAAAAVSLTVAAPLQIDPAGGFSDAGTEATHVQQKHPCTPHASGGFAASAVREQDAGADMHIHAAVVSRKDCLNPHGHTQKACATMPHACVQVSVSKTVLKHTVSGLIMRSKAIVRESKNLLSAMTFLEDALIKCPGHKQTVKHIHHLKKVMEQPEDIHADNLYAAAFNTPLL